MSEREKHTCGECTACCFTHSVAEHGTPVTELFEWCTHCVQGSGCSIYASRPASCQSYSCMWLAGSEWPEEMRPDRWGVVIDVQEITGEALKLLYVWECIEGRHAAPDIQRFIHAFAESGHYVIEGRPMNGTHDLRFPTSMTEDARMRFLRAAVATLEERLKNIVLD